MKYAVIIARTLLGLGFIIFGLNILMPFLPQPPMPEDTYPAKFLAVMVSTNWIKLIGIVQLLGGILVLLGRTAPMGLVMLGPVLVNIIAFHVFLEDGANLAPGLVFSLLEIFLIYAYRNHFKGIFSTQAKPA